MTIESVAIVGAGALGTALANALSAAGVSVTAVASRQRAHAELLARAIPGAKPVSVREAGRAAPIVLLTVTDSAIEDACAALDAPEGALVAHTSGSRDASALAAARANGANVGGLHPLAAVARGAPEAAVARAAPEAAMERGTRRATGPAETASAPPDYARIFHGAVFAIEGNEAVMARLSALASALGGHPFAIAAADKPLYHLGASMLAAFAAGLSQITWDQLRRASSNDALASRGVAHLLHTVADNLGRAAVPGAALTGPVARGDAGGVARQATAALALSPEAYALYRAHVAHNITVARDAGTIGGDVAVQLLAALMEHDLTQGREDPT